MKNLKKVLALVLAFAMVMTMFASAATYTDVSSESQYFNAVTLLSDLGIVTGYTDGTYGPEQTITRAEACALVARMLTGKTDVAEYKGASDFTDVAKDYWGESAIGYCVVNNIVVGDGDGKFRPDDAVTQAEFVTMITRGLGYETASSPLTYPYGYISAAQDNDILKDVTIVPSEPALRGMDAIIVYNAIFAEYPKMAKYQYVNGVYQQEIPTVAEYVYNIYQLGGDDTTYVVVGADAYTEDTIKVCEIEKTTNSSRYKDIGSVEYYDTSLTKAQIDSAKFYETKLYLDKEENEIVAIEVLDSQKSYTVTPATYTNNSNDSDKVDNKIVVDNLTLNLTEATNIKDELNTGVVKQAYEKVNFDTNTGNVYTLYDWNGDRYIDYVDVSEVYYAYVAALSGDKISFVLDNRTGEKTLPATDFDNSDEYLKTTIDMADSDEDYTWNVGSDVEQGSIVEIDISREYSDDDKGAHATYTVSLVDTLEGVTFTSVKNGDSDSDGKWYFDDTQYKMAKYHLFDLADDDDEADFRDGYEDNLGETYTVYLDRNGYILYATSADAIIGDYMVVLETNADENTALTTPKTYALLDDDTYKTLSVDSETDSEYLLYDDSKGFLDTAALSLVAYKLDENGKICDWNNVGNALTGTKTSYDKSVALQNKSAYKNNIGGQVTGFDDDTNKISIEYTDNGTTKTSRYEISDDAKIFVIASSFVEKGVYYAYNGSATGAGTAADPKAYSTTNWKDYTKVITAGELSDSYDYDDNDIYAVGAMFSTTNNTLKALALVGDEDFFNSSSGDKYPAIISSVTQTVSSSSSSKFIYSISAYVNGEKQTLKTEAITSSYFNGTLAADFGNAQNCADQLAWITVNNAGEVTEIESVTLQAGVPVSNPTTESATRAIVTSKNSKGLTYVTMDNVDYVDGEAAIISGNKADKTDYQAYASDAAFYIIDNRAANLIEVSTGLYNSDALDENPEGDYEVSVGTSSNIMTSVINGKDTDIYYVADLFFNDDGDIQAVVFYSTAAETVESTGSDSTTTTPTTPSTDTDLKVTVGDGTGTVYNPILVTADNVTDDMYVAQILDEAGIEGDVTVDSTAVEDQDVDTLVGSMDDGSVTKTFVATKDGVKTYYKVTFTSEAAAAADKADAEAAAKAVAEAKEDVDDAEAELTDALAKYNASLTAEADAQKAADDAATALTAATERNTKAEAAAKDSTYTEAAARVKAVTDAQADVDADNTAITKAQKDYDDAAKLLSTTQDELADLQKAIDDAEAKLTSDTETLNTAKDALQDGDEALVKKVDDETIAARNALATATDADTKAKAALADAKTNASSNTASLKSDLDAAVDAYNAAVGTYNTAIDDNGTSDTKLAEKEVKYNDTTSVATVSDKA
jgi:hypothetical protein